MPPKEKKYLLELGELIQSGTEQAHWKSHGFYAGYTDKGPVIFPEQKNAQRFPSYENAGNVLNGDERFKGARILEVEE